MKPLARKAFAQTQSCLIKTKDSRFFDRSVKPTWTNPATSPILKSADRINRLPSLARLLMHSNH
ncbi:hypothetical protein BN2475_40006 [Paraburkholderia ribeironis]|uniref:Uncharacterized protein n=1 Tax=Paraburkholderia ribeironis TaxID=1247936 RepID=A0A1N7RJ43_9BURK|nr:hypothetical protein BN2475_40006 [Paraburkholderia ribeironis]